MPLKPEKDWSTLPALSFHVPHSISTFHSRPLNFFMDAENTIQKSARNTNSAQCIITKQIFTLPPKLRNGISPQAHRLPAPPSQCDSTVHPAMKPTHPLNLCTRCFYSGIIWFFSKSVTSFFLALSSVLESTSLHTATPAFRCEDCRSALHSAA